MAFPSADVANRRVRELTGQTRPRRPQRPPTTNENLGPLPHVQHFSNTLGVLNPNDGPIGVDIFGYPVPPIATQADLDFYLLNPHQARPSVATSSSCLQVQDYEREGGWMVDAFGRQYYQARGKRALAHEYGHWKRRIQFARICLAFCVTFATLHHTTPCSSIYRQGAAIAAFLAAVYL